MRFFIFFLGIFIWNKKMFKFAQQLVFGASSEPEPSTASPTLNNKLGEVRQSRVSFKWAYEAIPMTSCPS